MSPLREGLLVGQRYRLTSPLGAGAMGEVWRAIHEELRVDVAVKFIGEEALSPTYQERFRFEAQVAAQVARRSPHVVGVTDAGTHHGRPYLVMELVEGHAVDEWVREHGPLSTTDTLELLRQVGAAIDTAHELGIFHRDVKPANILVANGPDGPSFKLADFGVAKLHQEVLAVDRPKTTQQGRLVGTPNYMSPQQFVADGIGGETDRWALAVVAYEVLTDTLPFAGTTPSAIFSAIMQRSYRAVHEVNPALPPVLGDWFDRAFTEDAERAFDSGREMADAFEAALARPAAAETLATSTLAAGVDIPLAPRRRWPFALGLLAVVGLAGGALTWSSPSDDAPRAADDAEREPIIPKTPPKDPTPISSQAPASPQPSTPAAPPPMRPEGRPTAPTAETPVIAPARPRPSRPAHDRVPTAAPPPPVPKATPKDEIL